MILRTLCSFVFGGISSLLFWGVIYLTGLINFIYFRDNELAHQITFFVVSSIMALLYAVISYKYATKITPKGSELPTYHAGIYLLGTLYGVMFIVLLSWSYIPMK